MPEFLERKLAGEARKKGLSGRSKDRYVYGAMNRIGAMRGNKQTEKGAEMERKHKRKMRVSAGGYDFRRGR
jgi:hypothetical protein